MSLKDSVGPWNNSWANRFEFELDQWHNGRMVEAGIRVMAHGGERRRWDGIAGEELDDARG